MKHRLNLDKKDPNYILLKEIFKIMDSRESKQILASYGFKNLNRTIFAFKIIFISMFFGIDIPFILNELKSNRRLCKFLNISEVLTADQVYKIFSEINSEIGYLRVRSGEEYKYYNFKLEEKTNKEILSTNTLFLIKENGKYGYENKNGESRA